MSLRSKTNIAIFFVLAALATMAGFSFRESRRLADKDRWVSHTRDVLEMSESLRSHLADAGAARRAYTSGTTKYLADFNSLVAQGDTLGVLYLEDASDGTSNHHEGLQRRVIATGDRISMALANLRLREVLRDQSIRDPLTGVFNRRYLEETLNREVHRAARKKRKICMVMLDLDYFKRFNDDFGRQAGDALLKEVAGLLKTRVRAGDLACRYGGEEFALVLFETNIDGAQRCVENLRKAIKQLAFQHRGQTIGSITISAGIADFPAHGDNPEDLIRAADEALYRAKKDGRDRVVICGEQELISNPAAQIQSI